MICDKNLEMQTMNLGRIRLQLMAGVPFIKRLCMSEYATLLVVTMLLISICQFSWLGCLQVLEVIVITCWYKFIEERALYAKLTPTIKFSYTKSFLPSTLVSVHAILPIVNNLLDKV